MQELYVGKAVRYLGYSTQLRNFGSPRRSGIQLEYECYENVPYSCGHQIDSIDDVNY